ncbi:MAG: DUF4445 domain-containing protein [Lachnospiraceae bacterium]|nr:DUF4445 domain-containing protein [Lachnospiraceae bacterium]
MQPFSEKVYLNIDPPTEDSPVSDQQRIRQALFDLGYEQVDFPLSVLQTLYPMCRDCGYEITVTLVIREFDWVITAVEPGDTRSHHYGLAVDYGSTTVVMQLVDLNTGDVIARERVMNGQIAYGTDILTRITYTLEDPSHPDDMQRVTADTFNRLFVLLTEKTGINVAALPIMVVSGNTTMIHFLLKLNAWTVFASPYAPVTSDPGWIWGREVGMDFRGMLYIIPAASNYVGGDIVSGLLKLDIHKNEEPRLFFDIGTNGELVIGNRDWMIAGAGAAGPALEGYISRYGMRADAGAIDTVRIEGGKLRFTTIGDQKPVGICGSGIIDLLAQMRLNGWINIAGELNPDVSSRIIYLEEEKEYAAVYATAEESASGIPLFFSQTDIRQYLDTKAAAYTMIECLMEAAGCSEQDLAHCYLSGAFTAHSDLESAITIGMFPDLPREKYTAINNTSLEGARILLLDCLRLREVRHLAESIYCVQFASIPDFLVRMQAAKFVPHTDMRRYPSVTKKLSAKQGD